MKIKSIKLKNYRNYENVIVDFCDGTNVLLGKNAQGKTNLLEAIFFSAIAKSTRTNKENDLISWDKDSGRIETFVEKKFGKSKIEIFFSKFIKKTVKINGLPIKKIGELLGELRCVYFTPDELKLIKESPEDRRRFMDIDISQTSKTYFYLLGRYDKILSTRNKLLKTYKEKIRVIKTPKGYKISSDENSQKNSNDLKQLLEIYNEQLADTAIKIILYRDGFITNLAPYAQKAHLFLTNNQENLNITYQTCLDINKYKQSSFKKSELKDIIKYEFISLLEKNYEKDLSLAHTTLGPHRDDIEVKVNEIDIRSFGSQGQQRTCALSLKLAEVEIINYQTGETPILILDDVLSELDASRRQKLLKFCSKTQTFISSTDFDKKLADAKIIHVENGKIFYS